MSTPDFVSLATFTIPTNLLILLGLSNGVYIGGKAVSPNSVSELDKKVSALRDAEKAWLAQLGALQSSAVMPPGDQTAKRDEAIRKAPDEYAVYITAAREAARMLKSLYGKEGTTFESEPIRDDKLMPHFP